MASLTVGDDDLAVHVAELSVGTSQKLIVSLRDNLGKSSRQGRVCMRLQTVSKRSGALRPLATKRCVLFSLFIPELEPRHLNLVSPSSSGLRPSSSL